MFGRDDALLDKHYSTASPQTGQQETSFGSVGSVAFAVPKADFPEEPGPLPSFAKPVTTSIDAPQPAIAAASPQPTAPVQPPVFKTITKTQVADSPAIPESMNFSALFGSPSKPATAAPLPATQKPTPPVQTVSAELPARQMEALAAALEELRGLDMPAIPAEAQLSLVALETLTRQALNGDEAALKQLRLFGYEHLLTIAKTLPAGVVNPLNQTAGRLMGCGLVAPACTGWQASASTL